MGNNHTQLQQDAFRQQMQQQGYTYKATIGSGVDGVVERYTDTKGLSFVVKRPHNQTQTLGENKGLRSLWHKEKNDWQHSRLNILQPLKFEGKKIAQIGRFESYIDLNRHDQVIERSDNLAGFFKNTFHPHFEHQRTGAKIQQAFHGQGLGILLVQLTQNLHEAADELHDKRFLHLDIAARNILVRLQYNNQGDIIGIDPVLADFDKVGRLKKKSQFIAYDRKQHGQTPIKTMDSHFFKRAEFSICSDVFAEKATLIGMLGMTLKSAIQPEALLFQGVNKDYLDKRRNQYQTHGNGFENDEEVLKLYLDNLIKLINTEKNTPEIEEISLYLKHYNKFLTTMPDTYDIKKASKAQRKLLLEANTAYVTERFKQIKAADNTPLEHHLLQLQRLQQIMVNDSKLQQQISTEHSRLNNIQMQKNNVLVEKEYHRLMKAFARDLNRDNLERGLEPLRKLELSDKKLKAGISEQGIKQKLLNPITLTKLGTKFSLAQLKRILNKKARPASQSVNKNDYNPLAEQSHTSRESKYTAITSGEKSMAYNPDQYLAYEPDTLEEAVLRTSISFSQESADYNNLTTSGYSATPAFPAQKHPVNYMPETCYCKETAIRSSMRDESDSESVSLGEKRDLIQKYKAEIKPSLPGDNPHKPEPPAILSKL